MSFFGKIVKSLLSIPKAFFKLSPVIWVPALVLIAVLIGVSVGVIKFPVFAGQVVCGSGSFFVDGKCQTKASLDAQCNALSYPRASYFDEVQGNCRAYSDTQGESVFSCPSGQHPVESCAIKELRVGCSTKCVDNVVTPTTIVKTCGFWDVRNPFDPCFLKPEGSKVRQDGTVVPVVTPTPMPTVQPQLNPVASGLGFLSGVISGVVASGNAMLGNAGSSFLNGAVSLGKTIVGGGSQLIGSAVSSGQKLVGSIYNAGQATYSNALQFVSSGIAGAQQAAQSGVSQLQDAVSLGISSAVSQVQGVVSSAGASVSSAVAGAQQAAQSVVDSAVASVQNAYSSAAKSVTSTTCSLVGLWC